MNLEFVVNKFQENYVSVIGDFKLCEELFEELEELGYIFSESDFEILANKNNKVFIISKCPEGVFIEDFYGNNGKALDSVDNDYIFVQHGLLSDEELSKIHAYKERIHLVVYNF